jgi:hypothetical protein
MRAALAVFALVDPRRARRNGACHCHREGQTDTSQEGRLLMLISSEEKPCACQ